MFSCGVFIDLKKAFDTVDHKILLHKLEHYGFRGVINKWFSSYLYGRNQTTQIGSYISKTQNTTCGVPQGSVLGPNFVIFRPAQRKLNYLPKIMIFDNDQNKNVAPECREFVRYLGVIIVIIFLGNNIFFFFFLIFLSTSLFTM